MPLAIKFIFWGHSSEYLIFDQLIFIRPVSASMCPIRLISRIYEGYRHPGLTNLCCYFQLVLKEHGNPVALLPDLVYPAKLQHGVRSVVALFAHAVLVKRELVLAQPVHCLRTLGGR